jgi:hypothetical protein
MGAMSWRLVGPYHRDPTVALTRAQHQYFRDNYDLPEIIDRELAGVNDAIQVTKSEIVRQERKRKPNPEELKLNEGLLWTYNDTAEHLVERKRQGGNQQPRDTGHALLAQFGTEELATQACATDARKGTAPLTVQLPDERIHAVALAFRMGQEEKG